MNAVFRTVGLVAQKQLLSTFRPSINDQKKKVYSGERLHFRQRCTAVIHYGYIKYTEDEIIEGEYYRALSISKHDDFELHLKNQPKHGRQIRTFNQSSMSIKQ